MTLAVLHSPEEWVARWRGARTAVTIGNFDGVHRGHQEILRRVIEQAQRSGSMSAVVTFDPHPLSVLRPEIAPRLLLTLRQRLDAIAAAGIEAALVLRFDRALSLLTPQEFVRRILVEGLSARVVLVGETFRFGHRQAGNVTLLQRLGQEQNFEVECIPPVRVGRQIVSSTAIRSAVAEGMTLRACKLLGRPYSLAGEIRTGTGTGRKLVVPTLNLSTAQELIPRDGVYATETVVGGKTFRSVTNIGVRPTFDGKALSIESHLFDFSQELRSGAMEICFGQRLRGERRFSGPEELRAQIFRDVSRARRFFERFAGALKTDISASSR